MNNTYPRSNGNVGGIFKPTRRILSATAALLVALSASASAAQYTVTGSGVIQNSDGPGYGVNGESVTFSFTYDDSTFTRTVNGGNYSDYVPAAPIPVSVIGSVSGAIAVDPITIANAYNDPGGNFDQWNFISGINGLTQANAWTSLGFTTNPGADFAVVNGAFVSSYAAQWAPSDNVGFGKDSINLGSTVSIGNATWTVAPVAPPASTDVVFVANNSANTILKYTAPGVSTVFADSADGLSSPEGIAFDSTGNMFVTNSGNSTVVKILPNGTASVFADTADGISQPYGIAIDAANNLYVGNSGGLKVTKLTPSGVGSVFGTCSGPFVRGVAVDTTGNVYVANAGSKIEKFTPAGSRSTYYSGAALTHSNGLTIDNAGVLYCSDFNQNKVVKFATPSVPTTYANTLMSAPIGIRLGTDGTLYAANYSGSSVTAYNFTGAGTTFASSATGVNHPTAVGIFTSTLPPVTTTLIDDRFDDGNIATNTLGTGHGFLNGEQQPVSESAGYANFNNGGVSTEVIASNPLDATNAFQANATQLTFTYGDISHTSTSVLQRLWLGYRRTGPVGIVYYPGAIGDYSFGSGRQGLYVSVLSQNVGEDGYTHHGNLVATNDSGIRTTLASWDWANPAQLNGLVVKLTTTATHYQLEFSGATGGVPTYTFGAASGLISGMGTVLPSTTFDIGAMNQYFGGTGGQERLDSVLLQRTPTAPATVAFTNSTPSANPVDVSGAPNVVPVELTRTGNPAAFTAQVVPGPPSTTPSGVAKYVYGTDYEFVSGTVAGSTVSFAEGQTTATVNVRLKAPALTKKGQFKLTLVSTTGGAVLGSPSAATVTINARDTAAPTIVLNTPVAGATFDITGTVKDAGGLSACSVKVNGITLPFTVNPLTGYVANAAAPFSVLGAIAENGTNMVTVTATDASGNTAVATKTVIYTNNRPALAGTYSAVLRPSGTPNGDLAGFVTVTVAAAGSTTGKITISGATVAFSGLLNNAGAVIFKPSNSATLDLVDESEFEAYLGALSLSVSPSGLTGSLTTQGTGGTTLATLTGVKTPYSATNLVPAGLLTATTKGVYTVAFASKAQSPTMTASAYPQGDGYATLSLSNAGAVTIIGKLADGTPLTASANLRADGKVAFFASLYKKLGIVAGDITFANLADSDVSGSDLLWIRPAQPTARYYRYGWENGIRIDAVGAKYIAPAALDFGQGAVNALNGNAALVFTDGQLASTITHNVNVAPTTGAVTTTPAVGAPYKLTLTPATGVFSGTFTHGGATDKFNGVLINKGANKGGFGYFLSTVPLTYGASGESGGVSLQP